jgi:hypothetical protein
MSGAARELRVKRLARPVEACSSERSMKPVLALLASLATACGSSAGDASRPNPNGRPTATSAEKPALDALARGDFAGAGAAADEVLKRTPDAARAAAVRAVSRYQAAVVLLTGRFERLGKMFEGSAPAELDGELRSALLEADAALVAVDRDLEIAEADPSFAIEICLACWKYDWTGDKEVNERDIHMLEIEFDAQGNELPEGDPRRRPTFRVDHGDVIWARASIAFQRSILHMAAAYQWSALASLKDKEPTVVRIPLSHKEDAVKAGELALAALDHAERCRQAYLAETDDDREWVPNPHQKNHPVPLEVDARLYETWGGALADLRDLVRGETGVPLGELAALAPEYRGPTDLGYLDVGRIFSEPRDIVIEVAAVEQIERLRDNPKPVLKSFLGGLWREKMKPSPIVGRARAARDSLMRGEQTLDRKLRYLFWFN